MIDQIYEHINKLMQEKSRVIIAIDGQAASGKTTFAKMISDRFQGAVISMDDYFLQSKQRTKDRLNEIGGNIDYERFQEEVIDHLQDEMIYVRPYNCQTHTFDKIKVIMKTNLIIIEGAYSMRTPWSKFYDLKIVFMIDSQVQIERIKNRNGEDMLDTFIKIWIPKENAYIEQFNLANDANYVVNIEK